MLDQTLDPAQLQSWRDLLSDDEKTSFIRDLIDDFLSESATRLVELQAAVQVGDNVACRSLAHRIQGLCGVTGAWHMMVLCVELEKLVETNDHPRLGEQLVQIQEEYARVRQALEQERP